MSKSLLTVHSTKQEQNKNKTNHTHRSSNILTIQDLRTYIHYTNAYLITTPYITKMHTNNILFTLFLPHYHSYIQSYTHHFNNKSHITKHLNTNSIYTSYIHQFSIIYISKIYRPIISILKLTSVVFLLIIKISIFSTIRLLDYILIYYLFQLQLQ